MQNQNYKIIGQVVNKSNQPLSNLRIEVWDNDLMFDDFVGEATSNSTGHFEISFTQVHYRELFFDNKPDLYFKIYEGDKMIHSTENSVLWNIDGNQKDVVIIIDKEGDTKPTEEDIRANFFRVHLKSQKQQDGFDKLYKALNGNWLKIKEELQKNESFSTELIKKLEFTNELADWGNNNKLLVSLFDDRSQINSMREIALQFNKVEFISKIQNTAPVENENKIEYAEKLYEQLFFIAPTAMLINIGKDSAIPILNDVSGRNVISVLEKQPDFNIKTTSIYELLNNEELLIDVPEELKTEVKFQLKIMQRIAVVSPNSVTIPALYNTNFHSASQIASLPGEQFTTMMSSVGLDENITKQLHANAQQIVARNEQTFISLKEVHEGTGIEFIDRSLDVYDSEDQEPIFYQRETEYIIENREELSSKKNIITNHFLKKHNLSWDLLFGDTDYCECGECTSVYSPASYYVELLQYLRNNNLDPEIKSQKGINGTPLEKLFKRRPDLKCLELTCKNTNTILPYVDLVNEVMENFVAYTETKPFNVKDETSGELLSEPQHTDQEAYSILSKAVFPMTLPYHQPIDAARIYLNQLGTSRHELIDIFGKNEDKPNRGYDAEFLGLTEQEYIILTKESFTEKKEISKAQYESEIDLKPAYEYYGYKSEDALLGEKGLKNIKNEFLKRTGIDYANLVDLLKTEYLNPNMPRGKSKVIMERISDDYSYLKKKYNNSQGTDNLKNIIYEQINDSEINVSENEEIPTCEKNTSIQEEISKYNVDDWVDNEFEKIGKLIVIESGSTNINGKIILKHARPVEDNLILKLLSESIVENYDILVKTELQKKGDIPINEFSKIGSIDNKTGKVTLIKGPDPRKFSAFFEQLIFISENGEKAVFEVFRNEIFLIIEKKDTCNLNTSKLQHLDGSSLSLEEYDRIHRFIRLWRKLGWTIDETDKAIVGLSKNAPGAEFSFDINTYLINQLVSVKKTLNATGLELIKLLSFWTDISTTGENSLYQRLFLTHNLVRLDPVFNPDASGNILVADEEIVNHKPVLMAALNLSSQDIDIVVEKLKLDGKLTIQNISKIYRYRLLSKLLGFTISEFVDFPLLFGNIFTNAMRTLRFIEKWTKLKDAGFSYSQIQYIIKDVENIKKPLKPFLKEVLFLTKAIYDGLNSIEETHKDLSGKTAEEQATTELVILKASLLLEPTIVEKIVSFLEGNTIYIINGILKLNKPFEQGSTLNDKLVYNQTLGTIQIKGILTADEIIKLNSLSNDPIWIKGIDDIQKQQNKLYKELFTDNFTIDSAIEKIIKEGDIVSGKLETRTAPKKRLAFLNVFLPYLRKELSHRYIIDILAKETGIEEKLVDLLVTKILKDASSDSIYQTFSKIKEQSTPQENNWKGYLIPNITGIYRFIIRGTDQSPNIILDGAKLTFIKENDVNEWWNDNTFETDIELEAGKLYTFSAETGIRNIYWKTSTSAISSIPLSALIPDFASTDCKAALNKLKKAAIVVSTFKLSIDEILFFNLNQDFKSINFNELTLSCLLKLECYTKLRNSLPQTKLNLLDFFRWTGNKINDNASLIEKIAELTGWKKETIEKLIEVSHFNFKKDDFKNGIPLLKLQKAIGVIDKIGVDIDKLFNWTDYTSTEKPFEDKFDYWHEVATSLKNTIRSKYNQTDWEQVIKPSHDQLRNNQKDALITCLLQKEELREHKIQDADGLFEFFLIDVQMDAVMETSRIKQAIASVQLFVQRCFLGLEEKNEISPHKLDRPRWEWMQRYRIWEANRKVFLYPENWIETNLRDDKSPFFKELESELLQKDINKQNVADALKSYLYKVDEVANMEVIGLYVEGEKKNKVWKKGAKLHVFSRTKNAPYFFYYRYLALDEMNWYPWEKVDVDINCYDAEDVVTKEITNNGCYLLPIVLNERLFVFFPQIIKKSKANAKSLDSKITASANLTPNELKPIDYHEIKMAWSEYRNGKWTQKQISKGMINHILDPSIESDLIIDKLSFISGYTFKPRNFKESDTEIKITVYHLSNSLSHEFIFDGNVINTNALNNDISFKTKNLNFHYLGNLIYSQQGKFFSLMSMESSIYFTKFNLEKALCHIHLSNNTFQTFHDINTNTLLGEINHPNFETFFQNNTEDFKFGQYTVSNKTSSSKTYHELKDPYSLYNWELFFHTPMALADSLSKSQQFEEAMKWYHYVFNPVSKEDFDDKRFWQFSPFKEINSKNILEAIFNQLAPNTSDQAINEWRNKPFMPHVVARSRPVAYMKWVVMKYIDNLIAWGDYLFRQDTIETINQATQLYVLAGHILGPRPMMIPKRGKTKPQTYLSLLNKWDAYGNAMTELELVPPFSNQTPIATGKQNNEITNTNIFGQTGSLYFCIPKNPKLIAYWDTIGDRLFKIRHSQNIEGVFRKMPLFEPPIDPALLVKAAAQGLSIASVLNDLNTPMPNYRFYYLLQKALELCNELKSLGGALLSVFEKKDNETIALIRSKHENIMNSLMMEIKKKQLEEAYKNLESLEQNRKAPEERMKYYLQLSGMEENLLPDANTDFTGIANTISTVDGDSGLKLNAFEKEDMDKASEARVWQHRVELTETLASILHMIPVGTADAKPFGIGAGFAIHGQMFGNAAQAIAKGMQGHVNSLSFDSTNAGKKGNFSRAMQDRIQQANAAGYELKQIDKQITAQKIRIEIANQEIANQQQLMDNALEVEEFLKNKFTNEELYTWMKGSLKTLYHQVYGLTYELAKKAEKVYRFERGVSTSNFIQSGYWDTGRNGLLAGEQLYVGLKQMEAAYQNERGYDYEITKHISLQQVDPMALILLRETGKCEFNFPEVLFDIDYAGHYKRRIKSVSISIPCIAGPYTGVNATLRLLENKFRNTAIGGTSYEEKTDEEDNRFSRFIIPIATIATSSAQNDSGMFELNFKDERYLPFEGAGVISKWRLELPQIPQFNYQTISDVIVHIKYTSSEGGETLKLLANNSLLDKLSIIKDDFSDNGLSVLINIKQDFPNEWHLLKNNTEINLTIDKSRLPYMVQSFIDVKIGTVMFLSILPKNKTDEKFSIAIGSETVDFEKDANLIYKGTVSNIELSTPFKLTLTEGSSTMEDLFMIINYTIKK